MQSSKLRPPFYLSPLSQLTALTKPSTPAYPMITLCLLIPFPLACPSLPIFLQSPSCSLAVSDELTIPFSICPIFISLISYLCPITMGRHTVIEIQHKKNVG